VELKFTAVGRGRPVTAFAGTGKSLVPNIFFDAGRNWASRPTAVEFTPTLFLGHPLPQTLTQEHWQSKGSHGKGQQKSRAPDQLVVRAGRGFVFQHHERRELDDPEYGKGEISVNCQ